MDIADLEWRDSIYNWYSRMDFCHVPLPPYSASWSTHRSMKESPDSAEVSICCRRHRTLRNEVLIGRSNNVFMDKKHCENFRVWEIWGAISVSGDAKIWRRDPGSGRLLRGGLSMDSTELER